MVKRYSQLLLPLFLSLCIAALIFIDQTWKPSPKQSIELYEHQIKSVGAKKAYEILSEELTNESYGEQHGQAHNFGDALYHTTGLKGIHICDSKFGFGCYHSFLEEAITDKGLSAINDLDSECSKQFSKGGSCQHGIGHGILSYLGDDKLSQALALCSTLKSKKTFSCQVGVFMEFNVKTMDSEEKAIIRQLDKEHPFTPCDTLEPQYQKVCYFTQTSIWPDVFDYKFPYYGVLCNQLTSQNKLACIVGIGTNATIIADFSFTKTLQMCDSLADSYNRVYCRAGASIALISRQNIFDKKLFMCDGLGQKDKKDCEDYITNYFKNS